MSEAKVLTCCNFAQTMEGKEVHSPDCPYMGAVAVAELCWLLPFELLKSRSVHVGDTGTVRRIKDVEEALERIRPDRPHTHICPVCKKPFTPEDVPGRPPDRPPLTCSIACHVEAMKDPKRRITA